ncbi:putative C-5 cytosine-specific DNA methylase [Aspergillus ellipticus CBS 707.79]|uniref:Putative C-5 cytosine-specific DNA methylase n=1 Tax=Aspergillus ellipticus CBS 707.79 TaxID=1448320 RepID=A0A319EWQ8_9EURO|nr:putative C-5 cytosine-specific DNA methylase [Aspergillus ellipticus CBS 707.79]
MPRGKKRPLSTQPSTRHSKRQARGQTQSTDSGDTSSTAAPWTNEWYLAKGIDPNLPEMIKSSPSNDGKLARTRLAMHLPPMDNLKDIYKSITSMAMSLKFDNVLSHLGSRPLRVVTACSGTESPLLALEMVQTNLREHFNRRFEFRHLFSAEIVPFKQAYIERNFHPPFIFRDVAELKDRVAQTAYGSLEKIPKNPDILIAGFSCVDFSSLNSQRKTLDEKGESGGTFWSIIRYAATYRPPLVVLENVKTAPWGKIKQHWNEINYFATYLDVDTKAYYLPQTRERGYMLCVYRGAMKKQNVSDSDMVGWGETVEKFKRPASSPAGMFLIDADDRMLEQIEKDMAMRTNPIRKKVDWAKYQIRHQSYRLNNALGYKRPVSRSQDDGTCQMPDFTWQTWVKSLPERVWDTIDVNFLRKLAENYDMNFKERCIELSQGLDREVDSRAYGIVGCITPAGIPYITTRGGPLCGFESLVLQGLPTDKLLLTRETQRELQDLAGNAMSSTVVGIAILSALIIGHRVLEKGERLPSHNEGAPKRKEITPRGEYTMVPSPMQLSGVGEIDVLELKKEAASSARYCVCERQTGIQTNISRCTLCQHTACSECAGNPAHEYERWTDLVRTSPLDFVRKLRRILPARLVLSGFSRESYRALKTDGSVNCSWDIWKDFLGAISPAISDELRLLDIKRSEIWTALYEGRHSTLHLLIGDFRIEWTLFAKAPSSAPVLSLIREILSKPIARMTPKSKSLWEGEWEVCFPLSSKRTLIFSGVGCQTESYEARCGLQINEFLNSKVWTQIQVQGPDEQLTGLEIDIRGTYDLLPECGTASACLHKKLSHEDEPPVYLFLDPTKLGDPKNDSFAFALEHRRIPGYTRRLSIAEVSHAWRSSAVTEDPKPVDVYFRQWTKAPAVALKIYAPDASITCHNLAVENNIMISGSECKTTNITLLSLRVPVTAVEAAWKEGPWEAINPIDSPSALKDLSWLLQKVAGVLEFHNWNEVLGYQIQNDNENSVCNVCVPPKPRLLWSRDARGCIRAYEDTHDAARYERQVKARPPPFLIFRRIDEQGSGYLRVTLNIQTLLHQAYEKLIGSRMTEGVSFQWRLVPNSYDTRNILFPNFNIMSNKNDSQSCQPPSFLRKLRPEQLRSLSWMIEQERLDSLPFLEEEIEEALLPSLMWRAEGRVTVPKTVRGGILADDVGYGKTAIMLGLMDMLYESNQLSMPEVIEGFIPSKATLIVVPQIMLQQWRAEILKFLGTKYSVLAFPSAVSFRKISIGDILESDIILVSWSVFNSPCYYEMLQKFTGTPKAPQKVGRNFDAWFSEAQTSLKELVQVLISQGPNALLEAICAKRQTVRNSQTNSTYVPSKRLRGKQYANGNQTWESVVKEGKYADISSADEGPGPSDVQDTETLRAKTDEYLRLRPERRGKEGLCAAESEDSDTQSENSSTEKNQGSDIISAGQKRNDQSSSAAGGKHEKRWDDRKEFNIEKGKDQDWRTVKSPLLHAFSFNRLVIDEFTYANAERLGPLFALKARSKWVLSGTPPLNDFADVNTIAPFLGVHLGVDDDDVQSQNKRLNILCNQRSAAENFQSFRAPRSEAWHQHRHEIARRFLDRFARKNVAEIDEIPFSEHIILIRPSPAERAIYLELYKQLMTYNRKLRRSGRGRFNGDQVERLDEIIGNSTTAEEALLKRCSSLALQGRWGKNGRPEITTCASLIAIREKQLADLRNDLELKLKLAAWVYCGCDLRYENFHKFMESIIRDDFGDMTVTREVYPLLKSAILQSKRDDWKLFFAPAEGDASDTEEPSNSEQESEDDTATGSEDDELTLARAKMPRLPVDKKPLSPKKASNNKRGVKGNGKTDDVELPKRPVHVREFEPILREVTTTIRNLIVEWVLRERALRFLGNIHAVQTGSEISECDSCDSEMETLDGMNILGSCGHALCSDCTSRTIQIEECCVKGCRGSGKQFNVIKASTLGWDETDRKTKYGGSKLDKLIKIIRGIPHDERALLFIQFPELMEVASKALSLAKIKHTAISATDCKSAQKIERIQKTSFGEDKVLILNLGGESAAGLNLQSANHVIFLSPMLSQTQYDYDSSMTQAMGRCRRYGQTRHVHIYHLLTKWTIDANIFQDRREKVLVERDGSPVLVARDEALDTEAISCEGPSLVVDNAF